MDPGAQLVELLSGVRGLPLKEAKILSEEHKAVLLVVIGYRRKGGVSKARVGEILGLEASSLLGDLLSQGLIDAAPSRELNFARRPVAWAGAGLLTLFAMAMMLSFGVKAPLNYSVFADAAAALLLGTQAGNSPDPRSREPRNGS